MTVSGGDTGVIERVSVGLMSCGLMTQVVGLCWLPYNLHPEDGVGIADMYAFALVLGGAALVGLGLLIRLWRTHEVCAGTEE